MAKFFKVRRILFIITSFVPRNLSRVTLTLNQQKDMNGKAKSLSIYELRNFWKTHSHVTTIEKLELLIETVKKKVEIHNLEHNDNATAEIVFTSEIEIAKQYPL